MHKGQSEVRVPAKIIVPSFRFQPVFIFWKSVDLEEMFGTL